MLFLKQRLVFTARALNSGNMSHFDHLFTQLKPMAKPRGDAIERLLHHFLLALELRRTHEGYSFFCTPLKRRLKELGAMQEWYQRSLPFSRFGSTFLTSAVMDYLKVVPRLHIVNIGPMMLPQLPVFLRLLASQGGGGGGGGGRSAPAVRITNIDTTSFVSPGRRDFKKIKATEELAARLHAEAAALGLLSFEFRHVDLEENGLHLLYCVKALPGEGTIVLSALEMLHFPHEARDDGCSPRDYILQWIRDLSPRAFCILDIDLDSTSPVFLQRFAACLDHHLAAFQLNDAVTGPNERRSMQIYEELIYGRTICNIISCEGSQRVVRPESMSQWLLRLQQAGFTMGSLSFLATAFVEEMLSDLPKGFQLNVSRGAAQLMWCGTPRMFFTVLQPL